MFWTWTCVCVWLSYRGIGGNWKVSGMWRNHQTLYWAAIQYREVYYRHNTTLVKTSRNTLILTRPEALKNPLARLVSFPLINVLESIWRCDITTEVNREAQDIKKLSSTTNETRLFTMGATRAQKELYFSKLRVLITKYCACQLNLLYLL